MSTPRLRWRRQERERGLARVVQGERGYDLMYGDKRVAYVRKRYSSQSSTGIGGYVWFAGEESLGIPWVNTSVAPVPTMDEAKAAAMAYVKPLLATSQQEGREKKL